MYHIVATVHVKIQTNKYWVENMQFLVPPVVVEIAQSQTAQKWLV